MVIRSADKNDIDAIKLLLMQLNLPYEDCVNHIDNFVVLEISNNVIGTGALEYYQDTALLRSLAVDKGYRGHGYGGSIYNELLLRAKARGVKAFYLLTESAHDYFAARGFDIVERDNVPTSIKQTKQFSGLCPVSATVMRRALS